MLGHARDEVEGRTGVVCFPKARTVKALKVHRRTGPSCPFFVFWHHHHSGAPLGGFACGHHLDDDLVDIIVQLSSYLIKEVKRGRCRDVDCVGACVGP